MNKKTRTTRMDDAAYAGFLRLLLGPAASVPRQAEHAEEVAAYVRYVAERDALRAAARQPESQAA